MNRISPSHALIFLVAFIGVHFCSMHVFAQSGLLFGNENSLEITLSGDIRDLMKDRGDDPQYHPMTLSYYGRDSSVTTISIKVKARGHFRKAKENCRMPPLLLNFPKKSVPDNSIFKGQDKIKLVTPCQGDDYVVREYLVYKLYNLLNPKSFQAKLVNVVFDDTVKDRRESYYGILLEDEEEMAKRNNALPIEGKLVRPEQTHKDDFLKMAVFQYMIGNTDWSVQYMQNIKLIGTDSLSVLSPVPYDFDHAGIVGAPYAKPAPELMMSSTQQRRYRGYCMSDMSDFDETLDIFRKLEGDFSAVYTECPQAENHYIKFATRYLAQFYSTINNPKAVKVALNYPCDKDGTGNVVIRGLKKD